MLIKTVVENDFEGAKTYKSLCRADGSEEFSEVCVNLSEAEYSDDFIEALSRTVSEYTLHTLFVYDYESSSDAGDGRDDYYKEESDEQIELSACIVKDGELFGVMCESFGVENFLLLDSPKTVIYHPDNYGGRNYHFYRKKYFTLIKSN